LMPLNVTAAPLVVETAVGLTTGTASAETAARWNAFGRGERLRLTARAAEIAGLAVLPPVDATAGDDPVGKALMDPACEMTWVSCGDCVLAADAPALAPAGSSEIRTAAPPSGTHTLLNQLTRLKTNPSIENTRLAVALQPQLSLLRRPEVNGTLSRFDRAGSAVMDEEPRDGGHIEA
jgi:hypothetical protein